MPCLAASHRVLRYRNIPGRKVCQRGADRAWAVPPLLTGAVGLVVLAAATVGAGAGTGAAGLIVPGAVVVSALALAAFAESS